jgi:sporulation protein YlmC with PRC-barrel domain
VTYRSGDELLKLPVRSQGADLGRAVDLVIDLERMRVVGLHVRCGDRAQRFLPLAAAAVTQAEITTSSTHALLDESAYYRTHGVSYRELRGTAVEVAGLFVGTLDDFVLRSNGEVVTVVVRSAGGGLRRLRAERVTLTKRSGSEASR